MRCGVGKSFDSERFNKDVSDCDKMMRDNVLGGAACYIGMISRDYCKDNKKESGVSSGHERIRSEYPVGRDSDRNLSQTEHALFKRDTNVYLMKLPDYDAFLNDN